MRKMMYFCLIAALLLSLSVAAGAVGNEKATVTAKGEVEPGAVVAFTVEISNSDPVRTCQIKLNFPEQFELMYFDWLVTPDSDEKLDGGYVAIWNADTDINARGGLARFGLQVKENITAGERYEIGCAVSATLGADEVPLEITNVTPAILTAGCNHPSYSQVVDARYLKETGSCDSPSVYYVSCSVCGEVGTDTFTNAAGAEHDFTARVEEERYLSAQGNCMTGTQYFYSCTVCGEKGEETFALDDVGAHDFTAQVETEEYLSDMGDCQNKRQYFYSCKVCGEKSEETFVSLKKFGVHLYDNDCDSECNVCGKYQEPTHLTEDRWESDQTGHWRECTVCLEKVEFAAHIPGEEATPEQSQLCTECGYVLAVSDEHQHEYSQEWTSDEKSHWHACSCGGKSDLEVHSWSVVDSGDSSVLLAECTVCGATKEEQVPTVDDTQPTQPPATQPTQPVQPDPVEEEGGVNVAAIVLGILLALSLAGNGVLAWLLFGNKKKPVEKKTV